MTDLACFSQLIDQDKTKPLMSLLKVTPSSFFLPNAPLMQLEERTSIPGETPCLGTCWTQKFLSSIRMSMA